MWISYEEDPVSFFDFEIISLYLHGSYLTYVDDVNIDDDSFDYPQIVDQFSLSPSIFQRGTKERKKIVSSACPCTLFHDKPSIFIHSYHEAFMLHLRQ